MDIRTIAGYLKLGYRVRRTSWDIIDYVHFAHGRIFCKFKSDSINKYFAYDLWFGDLLADDWQLITEGVVKDFPLTYSD